MGKDLTGHLLTDGTAGFLLGVPLGCCLGMEDWDHTRTPAPRMMVPMKDRGCLRPVSRERPTRQGNAGHSGAVPQLGTQSGHCMVCLPSKDRGSGRHPGPAASRCKPTPAAAARSGPANYD